MELWGIQIEVGYLLIASLTGLTLGGLLYWFGRKAYSHYQFSIYKLVVSVVGISFAVYYILHVVLGSGRTGWP